MTKSVLSLFPVRQYSHPEITALAERMTTTAQHPAMLSEPMHVIEELSGEVVTLDEPCLHWLANRYAELPWVSLAVAGAGLTGKLLPVDLRPLSRLEAQRMHDSGDWSEAQAQWPLSYALGLFHHINEHEELLGLINLLHWVKLS